MESAEKARYKERMAKCDSIARAIAKKLKAGNYLQVPDYKRGWGMAAWLVCEVAEEITKVIQEGEHR